MSPATRILLGALLVLEASTAAAQTLNPIADAYVRGGTWAGTNFGTSTGLFTQTSNNASSSYDSYLTFDTATVPSISAARLRVKASVASGSIGMSAYAVADTTWGETTINWNNKPARGGALASVTVTGASYVYYELDVSAYVIAEKAAGRNVVSFALHDPLNSSQSIWMHSRENAAGPPELALTSNGAPTVSLTSPADGASFNAPANIPVSASAADPDGTIARVEFYYGTTLITTLTSAPYAFTWTGVPQGSYSLTAKAFDNNNAGATSAPVNITVNAALAQLYFVQVDHLNTPRLIVDANQRTVWRRDNQEPFGDSPPDDNPSGLGVFEFPLGFPGQYSDKESGLHYNMFRDYDANVGRYGESDPIGLEGGLNTYAYVRNNPLGHVDPLGLQFQIWLGRIALQALGSKWGNTPIKQGAEQEKLQMYAERRREYEACIEKCSCEPWYRQSTCGDDCTRKYKKRLEDVVVGQ
jgi:RHS repeat-associated protein